MIDNFSWVAVYPEIVLLIMACVIAMVDLWVTSPRRDLTYGLSLLTLASVAIGIQGNQFGVFEDLVKPNRPFIGCGWIACGANNDNWGSFD